MAYRKRTLLPIGIHLGSDAVNMVQLEQTETGIEVASKATRPLSPVPAGNPDCDPDTGLPRQAPAPMNAARYEEAREFIHQKITKNGFRGADAVISLPPEHLAIQHVRLAPIQPEEIEATLVGELQGKLPFSTEEAVIRHLVAGTVSENNETKQDVIVLAARRDVIESQVAAVAKLGLRIVGVGVEPCAMCYPYTFAASHAPPAAEGPPALMIVYLGGRATYVAIVRGQEMTFVKGVELGTEHLVDALANARNTTVQEAAALRAKWREASGPATTQEAVEAYNSVRKHLEHIVEEIESCMRYHTSLARGVHVDRVVFLGPEARDRALVRVIGAHLGVSCEVGNPLGVITDGAAPLEAEPELAAAAGLSLFAAQ